MADLLNPDPYRGCESGPKEAEIAENLPKKLLKT